MNIKYYFSRRAKSGYYVPTIVAGDYYSAIWSDNFDRSDSYPDVVEPIGGLCLMHDSTNPLGAYWSSTVFSGRGGMNCFAIRNNRVLIVGGNGAVAPVPWTEGSAIGDQYSQLEYTGSNSGDATVTGGAVIVRCSDNAYPNNSGAIFEWYMSGHWSAGNFQNGGTSYTYNENTSGNVAAPVAGDVIRIEATGYNPTSISCKINGTEVASFTQSSAFITATGFPGIAHPQGTAGIASCAQLRASPPNYNTWPQMEWDNWAGGGTAQAITAKAGHNNRWGSGFWFPDTTA